MSQNINRQTITLFWYHATRYKRLLVPLLVFIPLTVIARDIFIPYITADILQKISDGAFNPHNLWSSFGNDLLVYSFVTLFSGVVAWRVNILLLWNLELRVVRDIATRVFNHLINLDATFHANRFGGSLVSQSNKLTGAYVRFFDATIFNSVTLVTAMVATIVILAPRAPMYTLALTVLSLIYLLGAIVFSRPVRESNRIESEIQSKQTGNLADSITNVMAIKSFARGKYEQDRYWESASRTRNAGLRSMKATTIRETYASTVTSTISIAAILIAILGVGSFDGDIATLFLIVSYTAGIGQRLWDFQNILRQYNRALGDASDMVKILQLKPEIQDPEIPEEAAIIRGEIRIKDLSFTHHEAKRPLFHNLNLHIKPGEKVGLVGHSGSGKTTLTKLLLRFSDIDKGSIVIDSHDIRNVKQDDLRRHITYVPQEPLLFHRSLKENISYGRPEASQREIEIIAKQAHAQEFIADLPEGYNTLVGERGVKLSGGQRQRVAIARAMLKNAPILVLDEATSALDSESEVLIQDALWKLMEGRTAIVIAHRLSTIQKMDRILVMDKGKIVEEGSHKELLQQNGIYAGLWKHQSGGFLED